MNDKKNDEGVRLQKKLDKSKKALKEIQKCNCLRNDLDAYLFDLAQWGLGDIPEKPTLKDYGIE